MQFCQINTHGITTHMIATHAKSKAAQAFLNFIQDECADEASLFV